MVFTDKGIAEGIEKEDGEAEEICGI